MKIKWWTYSNLLMLFLIFFINTYAEVIVVPANRPTIQAGIDAAGTGDTVLVNTGVYFENINFNGKNIFLGSRFILSEDTAYISQTVIDGNNNGSVVIFANQEDSTAQLCGFTIQNGNMNDGKGGGISINSANPTLNDLIVKKNTAFAGAGIYLANSKSALSNLVVKNNKDDGIFSEDADIEIYNFTIHNNSGNGFQCYRTNAILARGIIKNNGFTDTWGGGISCNHSSNLKISQLTISENTSAVSGGGLWCYQSKIEFDTEYCCSVYLNHSPVGSDISSYNSPVIHVVVDTFTVMNPTSYYANPIDKFTFDIKNAKVIPIKSDLFVSPGGDDVNNGLSPDQPLKTIGFALHLIQADEQHPHAIYLTEGVYSSQSNGEVFPIALKSYVSLVGTDEATTILDANKRNNVMSCSNIHDLEIKNMTIRNGSNGGIRIIQSNPYLKNLIITQNSAGDGGGILIHYYSNPVLENVIIRGNISRSEGRSGDIGGGGILIRANSTPTFTNVLIEDNIASKGGGIRCDESSAPRIIQSVIRNNTAKYYGGGVFIRGGEPIFENVEIAGNRSESHAAGVYCQETNTAFHDVNIQHNIAQKDGAGVYALDSHLDLQHVTISDNVTGNGYYNYGGGIYNQNSTLDFSENDRCNIYLNKAGYGNDIYSEVQMSVVVDTFTILQPSKYHSYPFDNFSFNIRNGKIQQVKGNVYVSPSGNNHNPGTAANSPFQTVDHALSIIYTDSLSPGIIHLAEGTYSLSSNNERLPIYGIDYLTLSGAGPTTTIIDAEDSCDVLRLKNCKGYRINNVSLRGADFFNIYIENSDLVISDAQIIESRKYGIYCNNTRLTLNNVAVNDHHDEGIILSNSEGYFQNAVIKNNNAGIISRNTFLEIDQSEISKNLHSGISCSDGSEFTLRNLKIINNKTGGFVIRNSKGQLANTDIKNNGGSGISCNHSIIRLAKVSITGNHTPDNGGGISIADSSIVNFDPHQLCNIYLNKATIGKDLFSVNSPLTEVYLDTFTVAQVSNYFASPLDGFDFHFQTGKITPVPQDLFVSPGGDDRHEGTSPGYPLGTIEMALTKILADSLHPRTIHLSEGVYSGTHNGEYFPINCRSHVTLSGEATGSTVLDAEGKSRIMNCIETQSAGIRNMVLRNGFSYSEAVVYVAHSDPAFSYVRIEHNTGIGLCCEHANPRLYRSVISDNKSSQTPKYQSGAILCNDSNPEFINVTMTRNGSMYLYSECFQTSFYFRNSNPVIINSIIRDNATDHIYSITETGRHSMTIAHSNIQNGDSAIVGSVNMQINWLNGNIDSDAFFRDAENGDYSLLENSPCINAGTALLVWQGDTLVKLPDSYYIGRAPDMGAIESEVLNSIDAGSDLPQEFALSDNYPNPFNSFTVISFQIPKTSDVRLDIYDLLGQKLTTLVDEKMNPGNYAINWNATHLASGVYIYKLTADRYSGYRKCLLLK